jgi:uncharacterized damage-inducible protein DinB
MKGQPGRDEAAEYYFTYINRIPNDDIVAELESQLNDTLQFFKTISEEKSLYRYEPGKWSIRQVLNHINDCERTFAHRALWFGRGFDSPLPSFDQDVAAAGADADTSSWASLIEEFRVIRLATLAFFQNLPTDAWSRRGIASGNPFSTRALAYIIAGHLSHHRAILEDRYLTE